MPKRSTVLRRVPVPARVEQTLDAALDKAIAVQRPMVLAYLDRVRTKQPHMTPAELTEQLERRYRAAVMAIGGASGAAAAVPGAGTAASLASGAAEITAFVSASAMYVLALAELHGVPVSDPQIRRALVLSVLVGEGGAAVVAGEGVERVHWAKALGRGASKDRISVINSRLGRMLLTRYGTRQGALLLGRALPLGVGAGVGAVGNVALARATIKSARKAFGPAPRRFPPRVVEA
ncbi:hypothetical protein [Jatrophihabitans endophyticus]|uniref:hypothetical protein n=1 Tax=Jatrophihabitans endophyticus TaxID=1206085 RepID=UPI001A000E76|nr:hypothetical protein [Jatrophihabitans endophyticus]MBE7186797.1 hypothetical protein [Jatrophihabitans endophyticus]